MRARIQRPVVVRVGVLAVLFAGLAASAEARPAGEPPAAARPSAAGADPRIDAFWAWWRTSAAQLASALDAKEARSIVEPLSARVHAIDPRLAWETGAGIRGARHHLALSSEGDPELRAIAERWLARAPRPDAAWEYYAARQAGPRATLGGFRLDTDSGAKIAFAETRLRWTEDYARELLHVAFHHPALATLSDEERQRVALLTLDNALGEDGTERWIGGIEISTEPLAEGKPLEALADAADALAKRATGEHWTLLEGSGGEGLPMVALVNAAVKRIDHLAMDHHLAVTMPYASVARGMPAERESSELNAMEDELIAALGRDAVYLGHETGEGRRVAHFHVAERGPAEARTKAWTKKHASRGFRIEVRRDPAWEVLRRWR